MHFISVMGNNARRAGLPCGDGRPLLPPQIRPHQPDLRQDDGPDLQEGQGHPDLGRQDGHRYTLTVYNQMSLHSVCLSVCLSVILSLSLFYITLRFVTFYLLSFFLSFFLSYCLSVCLSVCLSLCLSVCLSVFLFFSLFPSLTLRFDSLHFTFFLFLSVCLSVCLSFFLFLFLTTL